MHEHGGGEHINYAHTTDILSSDGAGSVLERSELDEFFHLAALANRDFTAERRGQPVVVAGPGGAVVSGAAAEETEAAARARGEAESAHRDALSVPRRPKWTHDTSAEELDLNERQAFLEWRRALVKVEEDLRCSVTPFEKNLEIWRQLWRVCERSDLSLIHI